MDIAINPQNIHKNSLKFKSSFQSFYGMYDEIFVTSQMAMKNIRPIVSGGGDKKLRDEIQPGKIQNNFIETIETKTI